MWPIIKGKYWARTHICIPINIQNIYIVDKKKKINYLAVWGNDFGHKTKSDVKLVLVCLKHQNDLALYFQQHYSNHLKWKITHCESSDREVTWFQTGIQLPEDHEICLVGGQGTRTNMKIFKLIKNWIKIYSTLYGQNTSLLRISFYFINIFIINFWSTYWAHALMNLINKSKVSWI